MILRTYNPDRCVCHLFPAPVRLCEFRKINGKILKTVDAVFQDVKSLDGCRKKCLSVDYRCQSFDLGDPTNSVCRLSHLASPSLANIEDPYLEIHGAATYEISSCYNGNLLIQTCVIFFFYVEMKQVTWKLSRKLQTNSYIRFLKYWKFDKCCCIRLSNKFVWLKFGFSPVCNRHSTKATLWSGWKYNSEYVIDWMYQVCYKIIIGENIYNRTNLFANSMFYQLIFF